MISLIVGIVLIVAGLHIFISGLWGVGCYLVVSNMISDQDKPSRYTFSINWKVQCFPTVLWLAGTLVLVLR